MVSFFILSYANAKYAVVLNSNVINDHWSTDFIGGIQSSWPEHVDTGPETEPNSTNGCCSLS